MSDSVRRFFTWTMIAIGGLIVALAGPCTLIFAGGALVEVAQGAGDPSLAVLIIGAALIVGGIPLAGGITLLVVGIRTLNADRRRPPAS